MADGVEGRHKNVLRFSLRPLQQFFKFFAVKSFIAHQSQQFDRQKLPQRTQKKLLFPHVLQHCNRILVLLRKYGSQIEKHAAFLNPRDDRRVGGTKANSEMVRT
jgi:hypothetical protein